MPIRHVAVVALLGWLVLSAEAKHADPAPAAAAATSRPVDAAGADLLTAENYAKIQPGMTKEQAREILGPWRSSVTAAGSTDVTLGWRPRGDSKHRVEVHFHDGKVVSKSTN